MSKQLRNFVFTWNNPYGEKIGTLEAAHDKMVHLRELLPIQYIIYGVEKGEKGTPHFQGYIELQKRVAFDVVKRAINNSHIESRRVASSKLLSIAEKKGLSRMGKSQESRRSYGSTIY